MTPESVRQRVADIAACASDAEAAHSMEDALYFDVLAHIAAEICDDPKGCADAATKSKEIEFDRWCA